MHNNYYFLRQLTLSLGNILRDAVISECFSQEKDELIIRFETHAGSFFMKASLLPDLSVLSFPSEFNRARKNSVDLFGEALGRRITGVRQFTNERSFAFLLSDSYTLLFKMHGNRANVLLFENDSLVGLFRKKIEADRAIRVNHLDRQIDWSFDAFQQNITALPALYYTFGKVVWTYLSERGFETFSPREKWDAVQDVLRELEDPVYYLTALDGKPVLSLVRIGTVKQEWRDPITALNGFFHARTQVHVLMRLKTTLASDLRSKLSGNRNYCLKNRDRLNELKGGDRYREWADLLMANLHLIDSRAEKVIVENIYRDNRPEEIPLKKDQSPQKNAELYYRKSKSQQLEIERIAGSLAQKENEIRALEKTLDEVESASDLRSLRKIQPEVQSLSAKKQAKASLPYHEVVHEGFRIRIGKNAESNDILTTKMSHKEDLWLHAKDVAGSHVVIGHQAGKKFPKHVIERAAALAAYYSKRKNETLCPVVVVPKKFVRKRKGDPAGVVVVEREKVILVEPAA